MTVFTNKNGDVTFTLPPGAKFIPIEDSVFQYIPPPEPRCRNCKFFRSAGTDSVGQCISPETNEQANVGIVHEDFGCINFEVEDA